MKVDLPEFLVGLFCFIGAIGIMGYMIFAMTNEDVDYNEYPSEFIIFGISTIILVISIMFYMGTYLIHTSQIDGKVLQNDMNVSKNEDF